MYMTRLKFSQLTDSLKRNHDGFIKRKSKDFPNKTPKRKMLLRNCLLQKQRFWAHFVENTRLRKTNILIINLPQFLVVARCEWICAEPVTWQSTDYGFSLKTRTANVIQFSSISYSIAIHYEKRYIKIFSFASVYGWWFFIMINHTRNTFNIICKTFTSCN
jgi:hypothetical protein